MILIGGTCMGTEMVRIDIRMPNYLLKEIESYQLEQGITNRTAAILELARIGLNSNEEKYDLYRDSTQRIDIRVPEILLNKIEQYQIDKDFKTRSKALKQLIIIGLFTIKERQS